jgi:hypothetical protein
MTRCASLLEIAQVLRRHPFGVLPLEDWAEPLPVLHHGAELKGNGDEKFATTVGPVRDHWGVAIHQGVGLILRFFCVPHGPPSEVAVSAASIAVGIEVD